MPSFLYFDVVVMDLAGPLQASKADDRPSGPTIGQKTCRDFVTEWAVSCLEDNKLQCVYTQVLLIQTTYFDGNPKYSL